MDISQLQQIDYSLKELSSLYSCLPRLIGKYALTVSPAAYYTSSQEPLSFEEKVQGNYWLLHTADNIYWLLPKPERKLNPNHNGTLKLFYQLEAFDPSNSDQFLLKKPAVLHLNDQQEWRLETTGILDFSQILTLVYQPISQPSNLSETEHQKFVSKRELNAFTKQVKSHLVQLNKRFTSENQQLKQQVADLAERLSILEQPQKVATVNSPPTPASEPEAPEEPKEPANPIPTVDLNEEEAQFLETYYENSLRFKREATEVTETRQSRENRTQGISQKITVERTRRGEYLVVAKSEFYLFLKHSLTVNTGNLEILQEMFIFQGKQPNKNYKILKPAKVDYVSTISTPQTWELLEQGIIFFT